MNISPESLVASIVLRSASFARKRQSHLGRALCAHTWTDLPLSSHHLSIVNHGIATIPIPSTAAIPVSEVTFSDRSRVQQPRGYIAPSRNIQSATPSQDLQHTALRYFSPGHKPSGPICTTSTGSLSFPIKDPPRLLAVPWLLFSDNGAVRHKRQGIPQILEA